MRPRSAASKLRKLSTGGAPGAINTGGLTRSDGESAQPTTLPESAACLTRSEMAAGARSCTVDPDLDGGRAGETEGSLAVAARSVVAFRSRSNVRLRLVVISAVTGRRVRRGGQRRANVPAYDRASVGWPRADDCGHRP